MPHRLPAPPLVGQHRSILVERTQGLLYRLVLDFRPGRPGFLHMVKQVGAPHNFQLVSDLPEVKADPFAQGPNPLIVPLRTFLRCWGRQVESATGSLAEVSRPG